MNDDLSEQTQAVLSTMRKHAPWPEVLDFGGFKQITEERWRTPGGDLVQITTDDLGARLRLVTPRDGHWLSKPRTCGAVFAYLHHQDDRQAAADDAVSAAAGSADATAAARSLPGEVLVQVARLTSPAVAVPAEPPVGGRRDNAADTPDPMNDGAPGTRHSGLLRLTAAADITPMSQSWLWHPYIPLGALTLLAGREQVGKSTCSLALAADVTQGRLAGEYLNRPRSVVVVATEDSWETTIVPRLMAAGADLTRVFKLSAVSSFDEDQEGEVNLPDDLTHFEHLITDNDVAFVVLDPLMPRLSAKLDTHRDGSVRRGLEPLVGAAQRSQAAILGLIHVNKTVTTDPLTTVMASRAFSAVPRSILFSAVDPEDPDVRYMQLVKSNLTSTQVPTMTYTIEAAAVEVPASGSLHVGVVHWGELSDRTIRDLLISQQQTGSGRATRSGEATAWLERELVARGGSAPLKDLRSAAQAAGFASGLLHQARTTLGVTSHPTGSFPNSTIWTLPLSRHEEVPGTSK